MSLERIEVKCRVITPMFSRGARPPGSSSAYSFELRPQSVKGVLRFWFRAIAPCVVDIYRLENLSETEKQKWGAERYKGLKFLESLIFGSQERKAPFGLEVIYGKGQSLSLGDIQIDPGGRKRFKNRFLKPDVEDPLVKNYDYVFYGLYDTESCKVYNFLPPGSTLSMTFFFCNEKVKEIILSLLHLISIFSGFGAKTRKGLGEFEIVEPTGYARDVENCNYKKIISKVLDCIKDFIEEHNEKKDAPKLILSKTEFKGLPEFPSFVDFSVFKIDLPGADPKEVIKSLYKINFDTQKKEVVQRGWYLELKRRLRHLNGDCVRDLKDALLGNKNDVTIPPAIMGLPLQYQNLNNVPQHQNWLKKVKVNIFSSLEGIQGIGEDETMGRKASPLFISIHKFEDGWKPIVLVLKSKITNRTDSELEKKVSDPQQKASKNFRVYGMEDFSKLENEIKKFGGCPF